MRVVVCSECFSPNLGDGVIACGVEQLIRSVSPDAAIDFRRLYATVLKDWLRFDATAVLGKEYKTLDLFV